MVLYIFENRTRHLLWYRKKDRGSLYCVDVVQGYR